MRKRAVAGFAAALFVGGTMLEVQDARCRDSQDNGGLRMKLQVETSQRIGRPVEQVFEAWVDPRKMSGYFISSGSARMEPGKAVSWNWDDHGGVQLQIDVKSVELGRELVFDWSASGVPTRVVVEFQPDANNTTKVTVRDGEWPLDATGVRRYGEALQGWVHMLACLKAYLEYEKINLRQTSTVSYGLEVQRSMNATPAALFQALTQTWDQWFGTPGAVAIEPEVGSPFWFDAIGENEKRYPHYGRFLRLERDHIVELTWLTEATRGVETRLVVELDAEADGARLSLSHTGFQDEAARDLHEAAWPEVLAHLDRWLADSTHHQSGL